MRFWVTRTIAFRLISIRERASPGGRGIKHAAYSLAASVQDQNQQNDYQNGGG